MRRWLAFLAPLTLAAGCAIAPENNRAVAAKDEEVAARPAERLPAPDFVFAEDSTKRDKLPAPDVEALVMDRTAMEKLAKTDPVAFLTHVIERYEREVKGYRVTLEKQERVKDKLRAVEVVECAFREKPFSVRMDWKKGADKALKTAYVKGKNDGNLLAVPNGKLLSLIGVVQRAPDGPDASATSRFPVTEFGIQVGTRRTLDAWVAAKKRGDLKIEFNGVKKLKQLNNRPTWELKRVNYPGPEDDGITEATFYFDVDNWLQIGSYLTGEKGKLIGSYYFRDLKLNPEIDDEVFTKEGLRKK